MGNKLELNVDRNLRIPLLALSAGSVIKESTEHGPFCLVHPKAVTVFDSGATFWRKRRQFKDRDNNDDNDTLLPQCDRSRSCPSRSFAALGFKTET